MRKSPVRPYLISQDEEGQYRLTVRETRYNSQDYPWVVATLQQAVFATAAAARAYARDEFGAKAGEFARE